MAFISKKIEDLINLRIVEEEKSSRLYLAMSKWLIFHGYIGSGKLWAKYSEEELKHADWSYTYLEDLDILPKIPALAEPRCEFEGLLDICQQSYNHEITITEQCNLLAKTSLVENDFMTLQLAQKYLTEQTEEIKKLTEILDILEMQGGESISPESLLLVDSILGNK